MCGEDACIVHKKLDRVRSFLEPLKPLANAHMSSFITKSYWELLPCNIKDEATQLSAEELYSIIWRWGSNPTNFHQEGAIGIFLQDCHSLTLSSITNDILVHSETPGNSIERQAKCMSLKKDHEISHLIETVENLCKQSQSNCVVDVGGGKGYLGSSLVLEKNIKVLSIDSKPTNTKGAVTLFQKIEASYRPSCIVCYHYQSIMQLERTYFCIMMFSEKKEQSQ